jgi:hypothetical protein
MTHRTIITSCLVAVCATACAEREPGDDAETTRITVGDTMIVRSSKAGLWGDSAVLVEEMVIGVLEGAEEYQFGRVSDLALDAHGGLYIFDGQAPALRYYDSRGRFLRQLGREGQGPGEYQNASLGVVVRKTDGRVVMRDPRNMRLNVYEPDGSPSDSWSVASGLFSPRSTILGPDDHLFLKILTGWPEENKPWPFALLHLNERGEVVDTLLPPELPNEPEEGGGVFYVAKEWDLSPSGGFVIGVNDRYRIEHHRPDGTILRIERDIPQVPLSAGERGEFEALQEWQRRTDNEDPPPVPSIKPYFRSLVVGEQGRIWVLRYVEAQQGEPVQRRSPPGVEPPPQTTWFEPTAYDVFEPDGTFLGTVYVPRGIRLRIFRGDHVWGTRSGEFYEPQVVRLRVSAEG